MIRKIATSRIAWDENGFLKTALFDDESRGDYIVWNKVDNIFSNISKLVIFELGKKIYAVPQEYIKTYIDEAGTVQNNIPSSLHLNMWKRVQNSANAPQVTQYEDASFVKYTDLTVNKTDEPIIRALKDFCNRRPLKYTGDSATIIKNMIRTLQKDQPNVTIKDVNRFLGLFGFMISDVEIGPIKSHIANTTNVSGPINIAPPVNNLNRIK